MTTGPMRILVVASLLSGCYPTASMDSPQPAESSVDTSIRHVDFLNFTYFPKLCRQEFARDGIGTAVTIRNGEFTNDTVYYGVVNTNVFYSDVTQDGAENALVHMACGHPTANFGFSEFFLFRRSGDDTMAIASFSERDLLRDYRQYFPGGTLWSVVSSGVQIARGVVSISAFTDGSHASPQHVVTFFYQWTGRDLALTGRPSRQPFTGR
jgi:hypothetical protein